jgi:triacylglycerol lipase
MLTIVAVAALVLLGLGVGIGIWLWRRRRRLLQRPLPPGAHLRYPVVLVHGLAGFDEIRVFGWKRAYFRGIAQYLEHLGATVFLPRLPPLAGIPERAARLADFVNRMGAAKVNIIAHSMGGLDARYAIAKLGIADKVASLVTIGTPHHGTPLADLTQTWAARGARAVVRRFGLGSDSLDWLTPRRMLQFNQEILDDPHVVYASVACRVGARRWRRNPLLWISNIYVNLRAGSNDGLVPALSQRWGAIWCETEADHWAQIGWFSWDDTRAVYSTIVERLARENL